MCACVCVCPLAAFIAPPQTSSPCSTRRGSPLPPCSFMPPCLTHTFTLACPSCIPCKQHPPLQPTLVSAPTPNSGAHPTATCTPPSPPMHTSPTSSPAPPPATPAVPCPTIPFCPKPLGRTQPHTHLLPHVRNALLQRRYRLALRRATLWRRRTLACTRYCSRCRRGAWQGTTQQPLGGLCRHCSCAGACRGCAGGRR